MRASSWASTTTRRARSVNRSNMLLVSSPRAAAGPVPCRHTLRPHASREPARVLVVRNDAGPPRCSAVVPPAANAVSPTRRAGGSGVRRSPSRSAARAGPNPIRRYTSWASRVVSTIRATPSACSVATTWAISQLPTPSPRRLSSTITSHTQANVAPSVTTRASATCSAPAYDPEHAGAGQRALDHAPRAPAGPVRLDRQPAGHGVAVDPREVVVEDETVRAGRQDHGRSPVACGRNPGRHPSAGWPRTWRAGRR